MADPLAEEQSEPGVATTSGTPEQSTDDMPELDFGEDAEVFFDEDPDQPGDEFGSDVDSLGEPPADQTGQAGAQEPASGQPPVEQPLDLDAILELPVEQRRAEIKRLAGEDPELLEKSLMMERDYRKKTTVAARMKEAGQRELEQAQQLQAQTQAQAPQAQPYPAQPQPYVPPTYPGEPGPPPATPVQAEPVAPDGKTQSQWVAEWQQAHPGQKADWQGWNNYCSGAAARIEVQAQLEPMRQNTATERADEQWAQLVRMHPEAGEPGAVDGVVEAIADYLRQHDPYCSAPETGDPNNPGSVRRAYMALFGHRATLAAVDRAQKETAGKRQKRRSSPIPPVGGTEGEGQEPFSSNFADIRNKQKKALRTRR